LHTQVLLNEEVIAVDQDPLGASADGVIIVNNTNVMSAQVSVWHKPLSAPGTRAAALLNTGLFDAASYNLTLTSSMVGLPDGTRFTARDLFAHKDLGTFDGVAQFWLQPTSITMLVVKTVA
jgi:alpha-galactosidase